MRNYEVRIAINLAINACMFYAKYSLMLCYVMYV